MTEILIWVLVWLAGAGLGAIFFGGLWWTTGKAMASSQPALWIFASMLLRMSLVLTGFYLVSAGHWERLVLCLLGFILARLIVTWFIRAEIKNAGLSQEVRHAPQSR